MILLYDLSEYFMDNMRSMTLIMLIEIMMMIVMVVIMLWYM